MPAGTRCRTAAGRSSTASLRGTGCRHSLQSRPAGRSTRTARTPGARTNRSGRIWTAQHAAMEPRDLRSPRYQCPRCSRSDSKVSGTSVQATGMGEESDAAVGQLVEDEPVQPHDDLHVFAHRTEPAADIFLGRAVPQIRSQISAGPDHGLLFEDGKDSAQDQNGRASGRDQSEPR